MESRYRFKRGWRLELDPGVIDTFTNFRQSDERTESGGILLGRIYEAARCIVVEVATVPNNLDQAGRYYFERSRIAAQRIVDEQWKFSSGERVYLGEWHSHPEPLPLPSPRDRTMIRNMFRQSKMETPYLFLVIVGVLENWVAVEDGRSLKQLECC